MPTKLSKIIFKGIETEPRLIFAKKQSISKSANTKKGILYVLLFGNYSNGLKKYGV